jgi:hypothetical protein
LTIERDVPPTQTGQCNLPGARAQLRIKKGTERGQALRRDTVLARRLGASTIGSRRGAPARHMPSTSARLDMQLAEAKQRRMKNCK